MVMTCRKGELHEKMAALKTVIQTRKQDNIAAFNMMETCRSITTSTTTARQEIAAEKLDEKGQEAF